MRIKQLAAGAVTKVGEISVPFVTSQMSYFSNWAHSDLTKSGARRRRSRGWTAFEFIERVATNIIVRKPSWKGCFSQYGTFRETQSQECGRANIKKMLGMRVSGTREV